MESPGKTLSTISIDLTHCENNSLRFWCDKTLSDECELTALFGSVAITRVKSNVFVKIVNFRVKLHKNVFSIFVQAHNWRDFTYEIEDGETDEARTIVEEDRSRTPRPMTSSNYSNDLRDEVRRLVTDPVRRAPPSTGRMKAPRKKRPIVVAQRNVEDESWDPPGHSTTMGH